MGWCVCNLKEARDLLAYLSGPTSFWINAVNIGNSDDIGSSSAPVRDSRARDTRKDSRRPLWDGGDVLQDVKELHIVILASLIIKPGSHNHLCGRVCSGGTKIQQRLYQRAPDLPTPIRSCLEHHFIQWYTYHNCTSYKPRAQKTSRNDFNQNMVYVLYFHRRLASRDSSLLSNSVFMCFWVLWDSEIANTWQNHA